MPQLGGAYRGARSRVLAVSRSPAAAPSTAVNSGVAAKKWLPVTHTPGTPVRHTEMEGCSHGACPHGQGAQGPSAGCPELEQRPLRGAGPAGGRCRAWSSAQPIQAALWPQEGQSQRRFSAAWRGITAHPQTSSPGRYRHVQRLLRQIPEPPATRGNSWAEEIHPRSAPRLCTLSLAREAFSPGKDALLSMGTTRLGPLRLPQTT